MKQKQLVKQNRHEKEFVSVSTQKEIHLNLISLSKKAFVLLLMVLGFSSMSNAQLQWGAKLGTNASTQSEIGNICKDDGLKVGFNAGVLARYQMNNWLAVKSGIDYQLKGKKCDVVGEDSKLEYDLSYLLLPVKAEFSAGEKAGFKNGQRLFLATGPYVGYLLDSKQKIQGQTTDLNDLNDFDFGWSLELGMEFPVFKSKALQVSLNYDMGISEIAANSDIQNKSASVNLGFLF